MQPGAPKRFLRREGQRARRADMFVRFADGHDGQEEHIEIIGVCDLNRARAEKLGEQYGIAVCDTEFGRQLGAGLFEFRLRLKAHEDGEAALLRVFCHAQGERVILLLGGYDKRKHPGRRRQDREILVARRRLGEYLGRRRGAGESSAGLEGL